MQARIMSLAVAAALLLAPQVSTAPPETADPIVAGKIDAKLERAIAEKRLRSPPRRPRRRPKSREAQHRLQGRRQPRWRGQDVVERAMRSFGRIDVLANNAGFTKVRCSAYFNKLADAVEARAEELLQIELADTGKLTAPQ
jgi:NAD(P)-dependent dehydrogenase (short-subunit alcohol dehydrogenase family)